MGEADVTQCLPNNRANLAQSVVPIHVQNMV